MPRLILVFFICLSVLAVAQDRTSGAMPKPRGTRPNWDKGQVEGQTYKNSSVGIEVTPPLGLLFGLPELKGTSGTDSLVTITAVGKFEPLTARKVMALIVEPLGNYPPSRYPAEAYLGRTVHSQRDSGYEPVGSLSYSKLGGATFARQDFKGGVVYESFLVKACHGRAFVFIFGGADQETVDKLSAATGLKFDPENSDCLSSAASAGQ